jgi:hypothetical protein
LLSIVWERKIEQQGGAPHFPPLTHHELTNRLLSSCSPAEKPSTGLFDSSASARREGQRVVNSYLSGPGIGPRAKTLFKHTFELLAEE